VRPGSRLYQLPVSGYAIFSKFSMPNLRYETRNVGIRFEESKVNWDDTLAEIVKDEGGWQEKIYLDGLIMSSDFPNGTPTVGPGLLLRPGYEVPFQALIVWTDSRFRECIEAYHRFSMIYKISLDSVRRAAIAGMIWNMGFRGVCNFKKMIGALQAENYDLVADEIIDSSVHRKLASLRDQAVFSGMEWWPVRTEIWAVKMKSGEAYEP